MEQLLSVQYECVIVDESHRARRKNLGDDKENLKPEPNNLYDFLLKISLRTHSMLLATVCEWMMMNLSLSRNR